MNNNTKKLTLSAMLAALAFLVMLVGRLPVMPAVSFLKYDPKDVVIAIAGFLLGPVHGLLITVVVSLIEAVTVSTSGWIGCIMNILSSGSFMLPAAMFYRKKHTQQGAIVGLCLGVVCMSVIMLAWNFIITPLYMKVPRETVAAMLLPVFLPFNLLKGALNAGITMLLYKPISQALRRAHLMPASEDGGTRMGFNLIVTLVAVFVIISAIVCFRLMG